MLSHHSGTYQCKACDLDFSSQEEFEEHSSDNPTNRETK
jgi:hypothetical protein